MPRKSQSQEDSPQKHRLTLASLASYDDVLSDALIDKAYYWSTIRKNRENKYLPLRGIKEDDVPQILLHQLIIDKDVEGAETALLNLPGLRRYIGSLKTAAEREDFRSHFRKYLLTYLPECPFEVNTTNRYTITGYEAAITARKRIREGDKIKYLCGTLVPLTDAELSDLDIAQRNFSVVQSNRKKNTLIFLGPARFANHDCAANGRLVPIGKDGLEVHATRNIDIGEEITVTYSPGYFGPNNEDCLCHTCELHVRNGWVPTTSSGVSQSGASTPDIGEAVSQSPKTLSKKRKHCSETDFALGDSSPALKRSRPERPHSRLNQVLTPPSSSASLDDESNLDARKEGKTIPDAHILATRKQSSDTAYLEPSMSHESQQSALSKSPEPTAIASPISKRKPRLIDQMTSSAYPSPETPTTASPLSPNFKKKTARLDSDGSPVEEEQGWSSEGPVTIKIENIEKTKLERDNISCSSPKFLQSNIEHAGLPGINNITDPVRTTFKRTTTSATLRQPSSPILPSIETSIPTSVNELTATTISKTETTLTVLRDRPAVARRPGDYIFTRRLVAQPFDRWVQCQTCSSHFLQSNGYQTRRECPRCERHSMLYGFEWPKTDPDPRKVREIAERKEKEEKAQRKKKHGRKSAPELDNSNPFPGTGRGWRTGRVWGRGGKGGGRSGRSGKGSWVEGGGEEEREERVVDHRTVNRFIAPEDEKELRKRVKDHRLELADGGPGLRPTPDHLWPGIKTAGTGNSRVSGSRDRGYSMSGREDSVGSSGLDLDDGLRRSKRFFAPRLTM